MRSEKIKPSYDTNRKILGKIYPLQTPFNLIIDSSERCNFQCSYCFRSNKSKEIWGYAQSNEIMCWDIFKRVIAQVKDFPEEIRQISISHHGEPLCNPELPRMIRYIKEQGIRSRVSMHTNASLLNEQVIGELAKSQIDKIVVSLQGLSDEKYKEVCKANIDFSMLVYNLKRLYEKKMNTQLYVKIMDTALEHGQEKRFYDIFEPIADRVYIETEVPIWKGTDKDVKTVLYNKYGTAFPVQQCCPLIFHTIVVAPNGDVYPCTQVLRKDKLGNIKQDTLFYLWNSPARKELLRKQCLLDNPEICTDCFIRQNSVYSEEDMIDEYREEILERLL